MCKIVYIIYKFKYYLFRKLSSLVIIFFLKFFEKYVIFINCIKRVGNLIFKF